MTDQKVVLITGASSGIGRATAELLTSRGYREDAFVRYANGDDFVADLTVRVEPCSCEVYCGIEYVVLQSPGTPTPIVIPNSSGARRRRSASRRRSCEPPRRSRR